jgi:AraC family transcriptional regulator
MHRVQRFIDDNLYRPLDLAELAGVANFSAFHFHRVFAAWMGETLGEYLRRRRLEVAATRLLTQPSTPVLEIALAVGFGSGEAFARAFRQRFSHSPSQWRRQRVAERARQLSKLDQGLSKLDQAGTATHGQHGVTFTTPPEHAMSNLSVTVAERAPVRVAYLRYVGPYGPGVARFWQQQFYPFLTRHGLSGRTVYGISHDNPEVTAPDQCRFDTGVELGTDEAVPAGAQAVTLPGGRYASLPFTGTPATIGAAWSALLNDWLPDSGYQLSGGPTFEVYPPDDERDRAPGEFTCEIVIPLQPL